jgi:ABC-2 type transport system permease protein
MFSTFFNFELRSGLRSPMPWVFLFVFAMLSFAGVASDNVSIGGSFGNIHKNAPFVAQNWFGVFSLFGLFIATAFLNTAAIRDFERKTSQIVFSKPIGKGGYYFGHFLGALLLACIPLLGITLGMNLAVALNGIFEWQNANRIGPMEFSGHINGFLLFGLPNIFLCGCIVYAVTANTRSTIYAFASAAILLVGYVVAGNFIQDIKNEFMASMLDPFGFRAFELQTKYWTVDDKNTRALGFSSVILLNRLLWMAVGLVALYIGYLRFDFSEKQVSKKKKKAATIENESHAMAHLGAVPTAKPETGIGVQLRQLWSQFTTEWLGVVRSAGFIILAGIGLLNCLPSLLYANESYDTHELPVTYTMINSIRGSFYLFSLSIMIYFSGFLVWKERNNHMNDIHDALPTKNWTVWLGKYLAVLGLMVVLQLIVMFAAVLVQKGMGYHRHEWWTYIREMLVMDMVGFAFMLSLSFLVHALSPNMYLGFFIVLVLVALNAFVWGPLDVSSNLAKFGSSPNYTLSDFYGYQPFLKGLSWFNGYWAAFCALLGLGTILLWPRGRMGTWRERLSGARLEWPQYRTFGLAALLTWMCVGGWTYYNTKVVNKIVSSNTSEKRQHQYEVKYKYLEGRRQPRVYDAKYDIDLVPEERRLVVNARFKTRNIYTAPIDTLWVNTPQNGKFDLRNERLQLVQNDSNLHWRTYLISPALAPGDSMVLEFTTRCEPKGFSNELEFARIVQNGTFFDNTDVIPIFGYQESNELTDKNKRKDFGLSEKTRRPVLNPQDTAHLMDAYIGINSDWVDVETIFRTAPDQIAIAPGSLLRQWDEGGRRCFHYKLDHSSFNFYAFMSARYEVARRDWNGVQLEVYYHKDHAENVPRMLDAIQKSLEYFTKNFGPYYHKQCRIVEFPRFSDFAQSFPGTMPYSEGVGFIQDFKDPDKDLDVMFYVAAHEIGHQYWGHQECGAYMQGSEFLVETFAQWSALMVMEHEYGRDQMRKFLSYEMDKYLRGRGRETEREQSLHTCEGQGYIHYNKGSVQMYHLKELIGEDRVNVALRAFLEKFRYAKPPYPNSTDVLKEFYAQTPDSLDYVVKDLFEEITLFENRCTEATSKDLGNGKWETSIKVEFGKFKADGMGKESPVAINDFVEIGAFAEPQEGQTYGKTIHRQRVKITQKEQTFTFVTDGKPDKAGIDPFSLLVDRNPEDNMKRLE